MQPGIELVSRTAPASLCLRCASIPGSTMLQSAELCTTVIMRLMWEILGVCSLYHVIPLEGQTYVTNIWSISHIAVLSLGIQPYGWHPKHWVHTIHMWYLHWRVWTVMCQNPKICTQCALSVCDISFLMKVMYANKHLSQRCFELVRIAEEEFICKRVRDFDRLNP